MLMSIFDSGYTLKYILHNMQKEIVTQPLILKTNYCLNRD
jgi:hypothetical protein